MKKVLSVLMIVLMIACMSTTVFADEPAGATGGLDTSFIDGIKYDKDALDSEAGKSMTSIGNTIITMVTNVGMILAVIVIAIVGVKYMMGSLEEKAEYKKTLMPYLVGAILVFGASAIGKMVVGIASSII